jgi:hypothetical protein|mmetsp:Transcript_43762/g.58047  ORF Transcript_43762/g.58047 Transcript_43762/m.58047 type:complete len:133 (-) Transcript_43762:101-499(-)
MQAVPNAAAVEYRASKAAQSMSLSQVQYPNHFSATTASADVQEQFEPTYVKLDKQVSLVPVPRHTHTSISNRAISPNSFALFTHCGLSITRWMDGCSLFGGPIFLAYLLHLQQSWQLHTQCPYRDLLLMSKG